MTGTMFRSFIFQLDEEMVYTYHLSSLFEVIRLIKKKECSNMDSDLKPSLQRLKDAREAMIRKIAEERTKLSPCDDALAYLRTAQAQLKDLLRVLTLPDRPNLTDASVHHLVDEVLGLLRLSLQDELNTMLNCGKNETSREYVRTRNEVRIVEQEQKKRAGKAHKVIKAVRR
jgi:hypothetical protein